MRISLFNRPAPTITFLCRKEDEGIIAPPVRAKTALPDWFRKLPARDDDHLAPQSSGLTVKRCMPFLDAMATGWVIGLPATIRMEVLDDGRTVNCGWDFDRTLVSNHAAHQVTGNPRDPMPPCKFHNYWTITTPPGWSCLFVSPLNRANGLFEIVSGIVDTDTYQSEIHFPFFATAQDGLHVLERGTPMVQVIPFRRDATDIEGTVRSETDDERETRQSILRKTLAADGWYRKFARAAR